MLPKSLLILGATGNLGHKIALNLCREEHGFQRLSTIITIHYLLFILIMHRRN